MFRSAEMLGGVGGGALAVCALLASGRAAAGSTTTPLLCLEDRPPRQCTPTEAASASKRRPLPVSTLRNTLSFKDLEQMYHMQGRLGRGWGGTVVNLTRNRVTGENLAVKVIPPHISECAVEREVQMLQEAYGHPSIAKLEGAYKTPEGYFIFLELAGGGELFERIRARGGSSFPEGQAARIMLEVLSAVAHLHRRGIVHMDLKPENIVLRSASDLDVEKVLLTDFGSAWRPESPERRLIQGPLQTTALYAAPEVLRGENNVDEKADVFSLGVIMYILLSGHHPFPRGAGEAMALPDMAAGSMRHASPVAKELLRRMLALNPRERPTAQEALKHPWFDPVVSAYDGVSHA